jgi:hypothetical protein
VLCVNITYREEQGLLTACESRGCEYGGTHLVLFYFVGVSEIEVISGNENSGMTSSYSKFMKVCCGSGRLVAFSVRV